MRVVKFGGSSLADASQIKKVCDIVTLEPSRRIVVVSAPGKGVNDPHKVTDMLIHAANEALENGREKGLAALECITGRYAKIADELGVPEVMPRIANDLQALFYTDMSHPLRFTDRVKAAGEDNCAKLVAAYLNKTGHKATYVNPGEVGMILSDEYGNAKILDKSFGLLRESLSAIDGIVVFPGFFGRTEAGNSYLSRGAATTYRAILRRGGQGRCLREFSDVDYVYTVNPKHSKPETHHADYLPRDAGVILRRLQRLPGGGAAARL